MPQTQETNPDVKASSAAGGAVRWDYISIFIDSSREMKKGKWIFQDKPFKYII